MVKLTALDLLEGRTLKEVRKLRNWQRVGQDTFSGQFLVQVDVDGGCFHQGSVTVVSRGYDKSYFNEVRYHVMNGRVSCICSPGIIRSGSESWKYYAQNLRRRR